MINYVGVSMGVRMATGPLTSRQVYGHRLPRGPQLYVLNQTKGYQLWLRWRPAPARPLRAAVHVRHSGCRSTTAAPTRTKARANRRRRRTCNFSRMLDYMPHIFSSLLLSLHVNLLDVLYLNCQTNTFVYVTMCPARYSIM